MKEFTNCEWMVFLIELSIFIFATSVLYDSITKPFREQIKRMNELLRVKEICDGCGNEFDYHLHDHYGYRSCSVDCDGFLSEIFSEQTQ